MKDKYRSPRTDLKFREYVLVALVLAISIAAILLIASF